MLKNLFDGTRSFAAHVSKTAVSKSDDIMLEFVLVRTVYRWCWCPKIVRSCGIVSYVLMSRRWWLAIFPGTKSEASANFVNASLPVSVAGKSEASISKLSVKRLDDSRKIVESVSQGIQQLIKIRCLEAGHVVKKLPPLFARFYLPASSFFGGFIEAT